jgi:hypothetical protein
MILSCLLCLRAKINAPPQQGGSRKGKRKNKDRQRMQVALMLEADYFGDNATHTPKEFRMNK